MPFIDAYLKLQVYSCNYLKPFTINLFYLCLISFNYFRTVICKAFSIIKLLFDCIYILNYLMHTCSEENVCFKSISYLIFSHIYYFTAACNVEVRLCAWKCYRISFSFSLLNSVPKNLCQKSWKWFFIKEISPVLIYLTFFL